MATTKLKKGSAAEPSAIPLVRNPDVLAELVAERVAGQLVVGFAAETGDAGTGPLEFGRAKLVRKGCDLLAVNHVGEDLVFGQDTTALTVLSAAGDPEQELAGTKAEVSRWLVERVVRELARA